jgi:hypothetical protein
MARSKEIIAMTTNNSIRVKPYLLFIARQLLPSNKPVLAGLQLIYIFSQDFQKMSSTFSVEERRKIRAVGGTGF